MRLRRNPLLQSRRGDDFAPRLQDRGIGAYRFGATMPNGTSSDQETIEATIAPFYHAIGRAFPADMIHYGVTKTADLALSRGLAKRMAGTGVTVNGILPGPTLSDGLRDMLRQDQEKSGKPIEAVAAAFVTANRPSSIIQHVATVDEVANLAVYVASPLSSATTGAALRVDGGVIETIA
jgi:NAD(P)-dependent dehydrogenase (short-subunit alcohol dehydrogenase family)